MDKKNLFILIFLTLLIFALLPLAPFLRDWLKDFLGEGKYRMVGIITTILFLLPVLYLSYRKPYRFLLIGFFLLFFLIKGAPEEKFHLFIYFLIGHFSKKNFKHYGIVYVTGIALIDEIIQYFLPQRFFDLKDILLNIGGGITGFLF